MASSSSSSAPPPPSSGQKTFQRSRGRRGGWPGDRLGMFRWPAGSSTILCSNHKSPREVKSSAVNGAGEANFLGGVAKVKGVEGFDPEAAKKRFFEIYIDKYAKPNSGIGFPGALELIMEVHKELQETMAQLEAIRYEIRSVSIMNPGPFTRRFDGALPPSKDAPAVAVTEETIGDNRSPATSPKDLSSGNTYSLNLHSEATAYAKLAEVPLIKTDSYNGNGDVKKLKEDGGLLNVLPISAESAGLLPKLRDAPKGSDIVLEAILEAEVARNAKHFFSQPENQIPKE